MLRILWNSTAPWGGSSYSILTKRVVPELVKLGHAVIVNTWYGLQGEPQYWPVKRPDGSLARVPVLPCLDSTTYGADTLVAAYNEHHCDVLISCQDVWVLPPQLLAGLKACPWLPIDHDPAPPNVVASLKPCVYPMVYSKWGVDVLKRAGIESHYVPCSAPAADFTPMRQGEARQEMRLPDDCEFLVAMIAANKDPDDRKSWAESLTAFAQFHARHPNSYLYAHTNWGGPVKIGNLAEVLGIARWLIRPDPYRYLTGLYPDSFLRLVYNAADVLLNPSKSEGFGLPMLEAQMAGCPVAATDFSTTDELLFGGWRIQGQPHWTLGAETFRMIPYIDSIREALEAAWEARGDLALRERAREGAMQYDVPTVTERYWQPALAEIEELTKGGAELKMVTF